MAERDRRQLALVYLASQHVMTLATHGEDGTWAAPVFYAQREFDLYFLSADHTRHIRHIGENPLAAAAIYEQQHDWTAIRGIQLEGEVKRLGGAERAAAIARYLVRFPTVASEPALANAVTRVGWFRLRPSRVFFVDNSQGLGHRDEILLQ
jgi:uncharacterized protein